MKIIILAMMLLVYSPSWAADISDMMNHMRADWVQISFKVECPRAVTVGTPLDISITPTVFCWGFTDPPTALSKIDRYLVQLEGNPQSMLANGATVNSMATWGPFARFAGIESVTPEVCNADYSNSTVLPTATVHVLNSTPESLKGTVGVISVNAVDTHGAPIGDGYARINKCAVSIK